MGIDKIGVVRELVNTVMNKMEESSCLAPELCSMESERVGSPPDHDIPLFSIANSTNPAAAVPVPAVRLSPIAPTTSMSPGRRRWTLVGRVADRAPGDSGPVSQGNGESSGTGSWNLLCKRFTDSARRCEKILLQCEVPGFGSGLCERQQNLSEGRRYNAVI